MRRKRERLNNWRKQYYFVHTSAGNGGSGEEACLRLPSHFMAQTGFKREVDYGSVKAGCHRGVKRPIGR